MEQVESEIQRYDRQIRVWGSEVQRKIQTSKILICGLGKVHIEVIKNIVLAGMNITIQSSRNVDYDDVSYNFFINNQSLHHNLADAMIHKIQELNNFVKVDVEKTDIDLLPDDFFLNYNVILMTECTEQQALRVNHICRSSNPSIVFFWSDIFGAEGIFYSDFGCDFCYHDDKSQSKDSSSSRSRSSSSSNTDSVSSINDSSSTSGSSSSLFKQMNFPSLSAILSKKWCEIPSKHFPLSKTFIKNRVITAFRDRYHRHPLYHNGEDQGNLQKILLSFQIDNDYGIDISNDHATVTIVSFLTIDEIMSMCNTSSSVSIITCSVVGSFLSQEIIKGISCTGQPAFNVFVFSSEDLIAKAIPIC